MAKTNSGLVAYCKAQVGKPYWMGTFGQTACNALYQQKKAQYPDYYTAKDFEKQFGQRVHDCVGLIKGYLWSDTPTSAPKYNANQDVGADGMFKKCTVSGKISTFQKIPGQCVFKGTDSKKSHIGVYVGNDTVIEAKGHKYGVVCSNITDNWKYWGQCCWIENDSVAPQPTPTPVPVSQAYTGEFPTLPSRGYFKKGDKGKEVVKLQNLLMWISPGCLPKYGADGDYGNETYNAVKVCQNILRVKVDGLYGKVTQVAAKAYRK